MNKTQQIQILNKRVKTFTIEEVFENLKKNGFEHLRGEWFSGNKAACVLGQAALNLKVLANDEDSDVVVDLLFSDSEEDIYEEVEYRALSYSLLNQLNRWRYRNKKWLAENDFVAPGLGDVIIHWNDKYKVVFEGGIYVRKYALPTYQDVVDMAYEVLKPHFNKTVKLLTVE